MTGCKLFDVYCWLLLTCIALVDRRDFRRDLVYPEGFYRCKKITCAIYNVSMHNTQLIDTE